MNCLRAHINCINWESTAVQRWFEELWQRGIIETSQVRNATTHVCLLLFSMVWNSVLNSLPHTSLSLTHLPVLKSVGLFLYLSSVPAGVTYVCYTSATHTHTHTIIQQHWPPMCPLQTCTTFHWSHTVRMCYCIKHLSHTVCSVVSLYHTLWRLCSLKIEHHTEMLSL